MSHNSTSCFLVLTSDVPDPDPDFFFQIRIRPDPDIRQKWQYPAGPG